MMIQGGYVNQRHMNQERRRHPRLQGNIPVKICSGDFDLVTETKNLSRTGTYCCVNKYIEPMTKLKIHLLLPFKRNGRNVTKKVSCNGVIVRTEAVAGDECFNVAIFFNDIQDRSAACIEEYVNSILAE